MHNLKDEFEEKFTIKYPPYTRHWSPLAKQKDVWNWIEYNFIPKSSIQVDQNEIIQSEKPKLKCTTGLSFYIAIGSWGKPRFSWDRGLRICIGFIAIALIGFDIENLIENADKYIAWLKKNTARVFKKLTKEQTDEIFNKITSNGCREMDEDRFNQAINEAIQTSSQRSENNNWKLKHYND